MPSFFLKLIGEIIKSPIGLSFPHVKAEHRNGIASVMFVIILVLGALALLLLKNFLNDDLAPTLKTKIMAFFN